MRANVRHICENCKKQFDVSFSKDNAGKGRFCSVACYHDFFDAFVYEERRKKIDPLNGISKKAAFKKSREKAYGKAYYEDHKDERKVSNEVYQEAHKKKLVCSQCGKVFFKKYATSRKPGKFCSVTCLNKWQVGPNHSRWRGGISSWPYCPKFNNALKEEVRSQFGRRCFLSGKEENGKKLAVHHCDYLKSQGCQGQRWSLLPLDHGWHSKTNANRWYWFALLRDYWAYKYLTFHGMDIYEGPDRTAWLWEMYNQT